MDLHPNTNRRWQLVLETDKRETGFDKAKNLFTLYPIDNNMFKFHAAMMIL